MSTGFIFFTTSSTFFSKVLSYSRSIYCLGRSFGWLPPLFLAQSFLQLPSDFLSLLSHLPLHPSCFFIAITGSIVTSCYLIFPLFSISFIFSAVDVSNYYFQASSFSSCYFTKFLVSRLCSFTFCDIMAYNLNTFSSKSFTLC
jgi:hypothetical protein